MSTAPVFHDPNNVPGFIHLSSHIFFWSSLNILCSLILVPRFWSTRIFTLNFYVIGILATNVKKILSALIWANHARYIPVLTEILNWLGEFLNSIRSVNIACTVKFLWICSTPSGMLDVYDKRSRINRTDQIIVRAALVLDILYSVVTPSNIVIVQGYGASAHRVLVLEAGWLMVNAWLPALATMAFGGAVLMNLWRFRHSDRWVRLLRTDVGPQQARFKTLSRLSFLKRFLCIMFLVVGSTQTSIRNLLLLVHYLKDKALILTLLSISKALGTPFVVYSWSYNGLEAHKHKPVEDLNIEFDYVTYLSPIGALHMFLFWGTGRQSRALYANWARRVFTTLRLDRVRSAIRVQVQEISTSRPALGVGHIVPFDVSHRVEEARAEPPCEGGRRFNREVTSAHLCDSTRSIELAVLSTIIIPTHDSLTASSTSSVAPPPLYDPNSRRLSTHKPWLPAWHSTRAPREPPLPLLPLASSAVGLPLRRPSINGRLSMHRPHLPVWHTDAPPPESWTLQRHELDRQSQRASAETVETTNESLQAASTNGLPDSPPPYTKDARASWTLRQFDAWKPPISQSEIDSQARSTLEIIQGTTRRWESNASQSSTRTTEEGGV